MTVNPTTIPLGEMRPGLFRIHWTFNDIKKKVGVYKQEFQLCGTQSGRKFNITYHLKSLARNEDNRQEYTVTLDEISRNGDSSDFEADAVNSTSHQAQPKRLKLDLKLLEPAILHPVYIWVHVGPNSDGINPVKLIEKNPVQWEADCVGKLQLWFTLWMDFGMSTVTEKKIAAGLSELFKNQTLCDVLFHLKDGQSIGAHVAILSAGSPVFAAIFQSDFSESKIRELFTGNVEPEVFIQMLTCLYTGSAPKLAEMARPLLEVADLYDVETLKDECVYVLEKQLSSENAIEMLIWSHVHVIPKLLEPVMKFVLKNCCKLCSQPEWMELVKNHPELCVQANQRMADLLQQSEN